MFNIDEVSLFFKHVSDRTLVFKRKSCNRGNTLGAHHTLSWSKHGWLRKTVFANYCEVSQPTCFEKYKNNTVDNESIEKT